MTPFRSISLTALLFGTAASDSADSVSSRLQVHVRDPTAVENDSYFVIAACGAKDGCEPWQYARSFGVHTPKRECQFQLKS